MTDYLSLAARVEGAAIEQAANAVGPDVAWSGAHNYADLSLKLFRVAKHLRALAADEGGER